MSLIISEDSLRKYRRKVKAEPVFHRDAAGKLTSQHYRGMGGTVPALGKGIPPGKSKCADDLATKQRRVYPVAYKETIGLAMFRGLLVDLTEDGMKNDIKNDGTKALEIIKKTTNLKGSGVIVTEECKPFKTSIKCNYSCSSQRTTFNREQVVMKHSKKMDMVRPKCNDDVIKYAYWKDLCSKSK